MRSLDPGLIYKMGPKRKKIYASECKLVNCTNSEPRKVATRPEPALNLTCSWCSNVLARITGHFFFTTDRILLISWK